MQAKFVPGGFFFCLFVSGCTWKSTGGVHATQCVCEMTTERYLAFKRLGAAFLNSKRLCPLLFSSTLSDERCSNLSFESPNQNPKNRTLNSHRDTGGTRCVLVWEVTMYGHLPLTKIGFNFPFHCGLFFF